MVPLLQGESGEFRHDTKIAEINGYTFVLSGRRAFILDKDKVLFEQPVDDLSPFDLQSLPTVYSTSSVVPEEFISFKNRPFLRIGVNLYRVTSDHRLAPIVDVALSSYGRYFFYAGDSILIADPTGYRLFDGNVLTPLTGDGFDVTGIPRDVFRVQNRTFIEGEDGLFYIDDTKALRPVGSSSGARLSSVIREAFEAQGRIWIATDSRVFVLNDRFALEEVALPSRVSYWSISPFADNAYALRTRDALYAFTSAGTLQLVDGSSGVDFSTRSDVLFAGKSMTLSDGKLFVTDRGQRIEPFPIPNQQGPFTDIAKLSEDRLFLASASGLFTLDELGRLSTLLKWRPDEPNGRPYSGPYSAGGRHFLSIDDQLQEITTNNEVIQVPMGYADLPTFVSTDVINVGSRLIFTFTDKASPFASSAYQLLPEGLVPIWDESKQYFEATYLVTENSAFVASKISEERTSASSLRQVVGAEIKATSLKVLTSGSVTANETQQLLRMSLSHPCARAVEKGIPLYLGLSRPGESELVTSKLRHAQSSDSVATLHADVTLADKGTYGLQLLLRIRDQYFPVSPKIDLNVESDWWQPIAAWLDRWKAILIVGFLGVHTLAFAGLIVGARHSEKAFNLLFDSIFVRFGLWFYAVLRWLPPVQIWLLSRWYDEVRREIASRSDVYLPVPITPSDKANGIFPSDALADYWQLGRMIWLQGRSGMGKTALVGLLERQFFQYPSLRSALRARGFVPIIVSAREARHIDVDSNDLAAWVIRAAGEALAARRFEVGDLTILRGLLRSSRVGILIDGLNEVDRDDSVSKFAATMRDTPVLTTSQNAPPDTRERAAWKVVTLPHDVSDFLDELLACYLDTDVADRISREITACGLRAEIRSGFDVRLIVDLAKSQAPLERLPQDRVALYSALLKDITMRDGGALPIETISKLAWEKMQAEKRQFDASELGSDLVSALTDSRHRILRRKAEGKYEFRHDQMRAFLAAQYLVEAPPSRGVMKTWLEESSIWKCHQNEQIQLFEFLLMMQNRGEGVEELWLFAQEDGARAALRDMCLEVANRRGWLLSSAGSAKKRVREAT